MSDRKDKYRYHFDRQRPSTGSSMRRLPKGCIDDALMLIQKNVVDFLDE